MGAFHAMTRIQKAIVVTLAAMVVLGVATMAFLVLNAPPTATPSSNSSAIGGPFTLVTMNGDMVTDRTYRGKWLLIYFGYTFCPDACPTALNNIGIALETLGSRAARLQPLFITVDPKRDTSAVLRKYLQSFDPRIVGLTGSQAQTDAAAKAYGVYHKAEDTGGDTYGIEHSAYFYLMNPTGGFVDVLGGDEPGDKLAIQLRKLID